MRKFNLVLFCWWTTWVNDPLIAQTFVVASSKSQNEQFWWNDSKDPPLPGSNRGSHVDSCRKRALFDALHWHTEVTDGGAESAGNFILFDEG